MLRQALGHIEHIWRQNDSEGLQEFLSDPRNAELPSSSHYELAKSLAKQDPIHALEWAATLSERQSVNVSAIAFESWLERRSADAAEWFGRLTTDDARHTALLRSIIRYARDHPQDQTLLTTLSTADREHALRELESLGMPEERSRRLRGLLGEQR